MPGALLGLRSQILLSFDDPGRDGNFEPRSYYHPYGTVGELPEVITNGLYFGDVRTRGAAAEASVAIRTFLEQEHDKEFVVRMRKELEQADTIVFLGFRFHRQNMELLQSSGPTATQEVLATTYGMSDSVKDHVRQKIAEVLHKGADDIPISLTISLALQ